MEQFIIIVVVVAIMVIFIIVAGRRTSLGALLLPRDVQRAARKAAGGAEIVDARADMDGRFELTLRGSAGLTEMSVLRRGEITVSMARRPTTRLSRTGSFAFRTSEADLLSDPSFRPEALAHARTVMESALKSKGFLPATGDQPPTLLVRYHAAYEEHMSAQELDRLHGFVSDAAADKQFGPSTPVTPVYKPGSLVIDVSQGDSDLLVWRAAAVAGVSSDDDLPQKLDRVKRAIQAMFEGFPP